MVNPRDFIPPEKRCEYIKKNGEQCKNAKMPGERYCFTHSKKMARIALKRSHLAGFKFTCDRCAMRELCPYYQPHAECSVTLPIKTKSLQKPDNLLQVWEWLLKKAIQSYSRELWRAELEGKADEKTKRHLERITKAFDAYAKALIKFGKERKVKSIEDLVSMR